MAKGISVIVHLSFSTPSHNLTSRF